MYRVVTPIADEPVSLEEARAHLRADDDAGDEALIVSQIAAARQMAEHYTGRSLGEQTLEMVLPAFPRCAEAFDLDMPPVTAVISIKYTDATGIEQTLDSSKYRLSAFGTQRKVMPTIGNEWPSTGADPEAVRIRYTAGFSACPEAVRAAMLLTVGMLYENREDVVVGPRVALELPMGARSLLDTVKVWGA